MKTFLALVLSLAVLPQTPTWDVVVEFDDDTVTPCTAAISASFSGTPWAPCQGYEVLLRTDAGPCCAPFDQGIVAWIYAWEAAGWANPLRPPYVNPVTGKVTKTPPLNPYGRHVGTVNRTPGSWPDGGWPTGPTIRVSLGKLAAGQYTVMVNGVGWNASGQWLRSARISQPFVVGGDAGAPPPATVFIIRIR